MTERSLSGLFIFDMDGVIVDTEPLYFQLNRAFFEQQGINVPVEEQLSYVGGSGLAMWTSIKARYGLRQPVEWLVRNEEDGMYRLLQSQPDVSSVKGFPALLDSLKRAGVSIGLASSSPMKTIRLIIERLGVAGHFGTVTSGDEVANGKPAPDIFLLCAQRARVPANRCVVLEDSANGVRAAKAAGMHAIGFANPRSGAQNLSVADLVVRALGPEIVSFVRGKLAA